ncbi:MAG TPA: hypothetical protein VNX27_04165 [Chthoniobacterales bacterium]|jgi:hypothetical protein|nr:hypothetical protein [Chthoniobacterales bacterium]
MEQKPQTALAQEIENAEILTGIRHALDVTYCRVRQAARADWERLFGSDPADACVTVRVQTSPATATRGAGFLKSRRQLVSKSPAKGSVPRFAH